MKRYIVKTERGYVYRTIDGERINGRREVAASFCAKHAVNRKFSWWFVNPEIETIDRVNARCRLCEAASL